MRAGSPYESQAIYFIGLNRAGKQSMIEEEDGLNEGERLIAKIPGIVDVRKEREFRGVDFLTRRGILLEVKISSVSAFTSLSATRHEVFTWARVDPTKRDFDRLILIARYVGYYEFYDLDRSKVAEIAAKSGDDKMIRMTANPKYGYQWKRWEMVGCQVSFDELVERYR